MEGRRRSSWEVPQKEREEKEDPVVQVRESELASVQRRSKRGSTFGILAFALACVAVAAIVAGYLVNEQRERRTQQLAAGRTGAVASNLQHNTAAIQNLSQLYAKHILLTEAHEKRIAGVEGRANQAVVAAVRVAEMLEQLDQRVAVAESQSTALAKENAELRTLLTDARKDAEAARQRFSEELTKRDTAIAALQSSDQSHANRLDAQDGEIKSQKGWIRGGFALSVLNTIVNGWQVADPRSVQKSGQ
jgi:hypothetical protein